MLLLFSTLIIIIIIRLHVTDTKIVLFKFKHEHTKKFNCCISWVRASGKSRLALYKATSSFHSFERFRRHRYLPKRYSI